MQDIDKIILMTKLAIYDKKIGVNDRKISQYFTSDYVFRKNSWTRFFVLIGCLLVTLFRLVHKIAIDQVDILAINYRQEMVGTIVFVALTMTLYTIIGTVQTLGEHQESTRRMRDYFLLLNKLDRMSNQKEKQDSDFREASYDGANVAGTRNRY